MSTRCLPSPVLLGSVAEIYEDNEELYTPVYATRRHVYATDTLTMDNKNYNSPTHNIYKKKKKKPKKKKKKKRTSKPTSDLSMAQAVIAKVLGESPFLDVKTLFWNLILDVNSGACWHTLTQNRLLWFITNFLNFKRIFLSITRSVGHAFQQTCTDVVLGWGRKPMGKDLKFQGSSI